MEISAPASKKWGARIYPGGRCEIKAVYPNQIMSVEQGLAALNQGKIAIVNENEMLTLLARRQASR